jgi:F0F1-type ATP synthase assembly protein I
MVTTEKGDPPQPADDPRSGAADSGVSGAKARETGGGQGEEVAWSALSSLLAGFFLWFAIGWGADVLFDTGRIFRTIGIFVGFGLGMYIVYIRYGRGPKTPPDDRSRN